MRTVASGQRGADAASRSACSADHLSVRFHHVDNAAGHFYAMFTFRNTFSAVCTMRGYARVVFVGPGHRSPIGAPSRNNSSSPAALVKLKPDAVTKEFVDIIDPDVYDSSQATVAGFRVYPPGSATSAFVPYRARAATSPQAIQLTLDPIGSSAAR